MHANADAVVRRQETSEEDVLVMEHTWHDHSLIILNNFADKPRAVRISAKTAGTRTLVDLLWTDERQPRRPAGDP